MKFRSGGFFDLLFNMELKNGGQDFSGNFLFQFPFCEIFHSRRKKSKKSEFQNVWKIQIWSEGCLYITTRVKCSFLGYIEMILHARTWTRSGFRSSIRDRKSDLRWSILHARLFCTFSTIIFGSVRRRDPTLTRPWFSLCSISFFSPWKVIW